MKSRIDRIAHVHALPGTLRRPESCEVWEAGHLKPCGSGKLSWGLDTCELWEAGKFLGLVRLEIGWAAESGSLWGLGGWKLVV